MNCQKYLGLDVHQATIAFSNVIAKITTVAKGRIEHRAHQKANPENHSMASKPEEANTI